MSTYLTAAEQIRDLRRNLLCDTDGSSEADGLQPMAQANYLLALAALEQAQQFMSLAFYFQARGD